MKIDLIDLLESMVENETDPIRMRILIGVKTELEDMETSLAACLTLFDFYARSHKAKFDAMKEGAKGEPGGIDRWNKQITNQSMVKLLQEKHGIDFDVIKDDTELAEFRKELFAMADFTTDHLDKKED
jgi:hypothetical protein